MAARRSSYLDRPSYLYLGEERENSSTASDTQFDFDESEVWNSDEIVTSESKKSIPSSRLMKKPALRKSTTATAIDRRPKTSSSLPVKIPDWSKILRDEYGENRRRESEDNVGSDDGDDEEDGRVPPHEYLARTRMASFSVHEGIGRTLKGRDLSRVRNAVWKQIGFED